jgi:hypothetical protein
MGKVKSIRFNDRTERMFNVLKEYYSKTGVISDTEIIANGIESQYDEVSGEMNNLFREKMLQMLTNSMIGRDVFEQSANMLEILSVSRGSILQDEYWCFLTVNVEQSAVYSVVDGEREFSNKQYEKIYETLLKSYDESSLEQALDTIMESFNELFKDEYIEKK